jgi:hypothetical protein
MGTKTRYREPKELADKIAEEIPTSEKIKVDGEPSADAVVVRHESDAPPDVAVDEATARLQRQIEELRRSEELQRQAATMPQRPPSREEKLAAWRAQGMSAEDERALTERPEMIDYPRLTAVAAHEAAQHHERGTDRHRQATREIFDQHLAHLQAQVQSPAEPPPQSFRPPPPPEPPSPASYVSAPVSRGEAGGYLREPSPSSVRLTPEQREAAALAGITDVEYAKNLIRMRKEIASGDRQR